MTQLSEHFTLKEMERSQIALRRGIDNTAPPEAVSNLTRLCQQLGEPIRALLAVPLHTDSGYRCPQVNILVGSTAPHSAHLDGRAADWIPIGMELRAAFDLVKASAFPFDQLIIECAAWLHCAIAIDGIEPRRECMIGTRSNGQWVYTHV
jgi:zinc D-Ala-D-Ala carboxypeptidase